MPAQQGALDRDRTSQAIDRNNHKHRDLNVLQRLLDNIVNCPVSTLAPKHRGIYASGEDSRVPLADKLLMHLAKCIHSVTGQSGFQSSQTGTNYLADAPTEVAARGVVVSTTGVEPQYDTIHGPSICSHRHRSLAALSLARATALPRRNECQQRHVSHGSPVSDG